MAKGRECRTKVRLKNSLCSPSLWEGLGKGRSYNKERSKLLLRAGFQPARIVVSLS